MSSPVSPVNATATPPSRWRVGLTARVFSGIAVIVIVVVVVASLIISTSVRRASHEQARRSLEQSADLVAQFLAGRERSLAGGARVFVQGPYFRTLVAERRGDDILDQAIEARAQLDADWVFITNELGVLLAKSDEPGAVGKAMGDLPLVADALRGQVKSGFGVSRDSMLFQAVAVPIAIPGGKTVGVLVATKILDSLLARDVKAATSSEVLFFARDTANREHIAASTLGRGAALLTALQEMTRRIGSGAERQPDVRVQNVDYLAQGTSLTTAGGELVGGFFVLRSREAELTGITGVRRSLAVAGALGLVLALVAAYFVARQVSRPVRTLATAVRRASDGNYEVDVTTSVGASNAGREIASLADAFDALLADLRDKDALMAMSSSNLLSAPSDAPPTSSDATPRRKFGMHTGGTLSLPRSRMSPRAGIVIEPGAVVANRYLIEANIGSGGLGIVYRARDRVLGETVAMKVLRPEVVASDPNALERFKQELRLARRISHRNVVRTHDIGESEGVPFLTMEYVDGASLTNVIDARGSLPVPAVLSIAKQLMRALTVAHEQGVIHGDLKPQNLLVGPNGVLKVADFGIARFIRRANPHRGLSGATADDATVGRVAGAILGTPEYMAPEQLIGEPASARTDIYSAGVVLHECLSGETAGRADTPMAFIARKLDAPASGALRVHSGRDGALDALIARMIDPNEQARPDSPSELFDQFAQLG